MKHPNKFFVKTLGWIKTTNADNLFIFDERSDKKGQTGYISMMGK